MRSRELDGNDTAAVTGSILYEQHSRQTLVYLLIIAVGICFFLYAEGRLWGSLLIAFGLIMMFAFKSKKITTVTDECIVAYPSNAGEQPFVLFLDEILSWELKTAADGTCVCYYGMEDGTFASIDVVHKVRFYNVMKRLMPEREILIRRRNKK